MAEPLRLDPLRAALPAAIAAQLRSARELLQAQERRPQEFPLPTGLPALDRLLEGGLPRGALVEISGPRSSGRFSIALSILATATQAGEAAAWVDLGGEIDPQAAHAAGCALERLLWTRPPNLRGALLAAEMMIHSGFQITLLDLGSAGSAGRTAETAWLRLARQAEARAATLLLSSPRRMSGASAAAVLRTHTARALWNGWQGQRGSRLLCGLAVRCQLERFLHRGADQTVTLELHGAS